MEPRRSEGPEPGSHSSVGCHSETINKSQISEVLSLLVASWYSTCSGHKVTLMSPLMPFDLNIDSWDPVVKERIVFFSCMCREVSVALHSASFCNWCILPWRHPGCRASPQRKHNPLWAPCRSSPSWLQEHWTSTWGTACKEEKKKKKKTRLLPWRHLTSSWAYLKDDQICLGKFALFFSDVSRQLSSLPC